MEEQIAGDKKERGHAYLGYAVAEEHLHDVVEVGSVQVRPVGNGFERSSAMNDHYEEREGKPQECDELRISLVHVAS